MFGGNGFLLFIFDKTRKKTMRKEKKVKSISLKGELYACRKEDCPSSYLKTKKKGRKYFDCGNLFLLILFDNEIWFRGEFQARLEEAPRW